MNVEVRKEMKSCRCELKEAIIAEVRLTNKGRGTCIYIHEHRHLKCSIALRERRPDMVR